MLFFSLSRGRVAGHPLAQNERSLHVFLQDPAIDHDKYVPGKVRNS
jgi:sorting nexin-3/12